MFCFLIRIASSLLMSTHYFQHKVILNYPKSAAMGFFQETQERVRNSRGKRAIGVRATEGPLYLTSLNDERFFIDHTDLLCIVLSSNKPSPVCLWMQLLKHGSFIHMNRASRAIQNRTEQSHQLANCRPPSIVSIWTHNAMVVYSFRIPLL